MLPRFHSQ